MGLHLFKKRVDQHNHLPTWFNLKTEFEEAFPNVGDLFFSPLGDICIQSLFDSKFKKWPLFLEWKSRKCLLKFVSKIVLTFQLS